jgi:hypothetical protein
MLRLVIGFIALVVLISSNFSFAQTPPVEGKSALAEAARLFQMGSAQPGKYADAAKYFAAAFRSVEMTTEQQAAWAYCRVRMANEQLAKANGDPRLASDIISEVEEALKLAPQNEKLLATGSAIIQQAKLAGGTAKPKATPVSTDTSSFAINGDDALRQKCEEVRRAVFERWAGNVPAAWGPKCEVVLHATGEAFTQATQKPASTRGHATVELSENKVVRRRLDLNMTGDRETLLADVLPRELTHMILADLFPTKPPPPWAALGMATYATSLIEQDRYRRTMIRQKTTLIPLGQLLALLNTPADKLTEYHVESAAIVYYLVKWRGEKEFMLYLSLAGRYGQEAALKQTYGVENIPQLETAWHQAMLAP